MRKHDFILERRHRPLTPEEAIERIKEHVAIHRYNEPQAIRIAEALQMGIDALEKQIPKKPIETRDTAWGIPSKQAVCPKCDKYLGHVAFLDDYKGKRITYCETCGQAVDWEGWDFDE